MLFDTHAHDDDERFDADRDALLASMPEKNVGLIVNPGCDLPTSRMAVALAEKFDFVYAAVGIHPENCGDLNVAHREIDLKNPKTNRQNPGFTDQEREKMSQLLDAGFVDTFRYIHGDVTDRYSWWSYRFHARDKNVGWRIDYFLVSARFIGKVKAADIRSDIFGSDHCPVYLELEV